MSESGSGLGVIRRVKTLSPALSNQIKQEGARRRIRHTKSLRVDPKKLEKVKQDMSAIEELMKSKKIRVGMLAEIIQLYDEEADLAASTHTAVPLPLPAVKKSGDSASLKPDEGLEEQKEVKLVEKPKNEEWDALDQSLQDTFWEEHTEHRGKYHLGIAVKGWRESMEDAMDVSSTYNHDLPNLFAVYDGHGGSECANYCKNQMLKTVAFHKDLERNPKSALVDSFVNVDDQFNSLAMKQNLQAGATATVVYIAPIDVNNAVQKGKRSGKFSNEEVNNPRFSEAVNRDDMKAALKNESKGVKGGKKKMAYKFHVASVGDSRSVLVYDTGKVVAITNDHNLKRKDELERVRQEEGEIRYDSEFNELVVYSPEAERGLNVTRSIGDKDFKPLITAYPEVKEGFLGEHAAFVVIASDGLWEHVKLEEVGRVLLDYGLSAGLINLANLANTRGTSDNTTLVAVDVQKLIANMNEELSK